MSFDSLGLAPPLLRAVAEQGYTTPTPIQQRAVPEILAGRDLLAAAQTGTGKTAAFTLPLLHRLSAEAVDPAHRHVRVLVLVPTRELAVQVEDSVRTYGQGLPALRAALIFGGVSIKPQIETLRRGVDIVVATPGRLLDHVQQRTVDLSRVGYLVLDEADRMLDMGFIRDIRRVIEKLPSRRQNLLFSATFSPDIRKLAEGLLHNPATIDIAPRNSAAEAVTQRAIFVDKIDKAGLLGYMISRFNWRQVLVFTRTKHGANRLTERLIKDGITAAALHGNKSQNARLKALEGFKTGQVRALVATDIAARGLDIDQLPHVINFELPAVPEDYVHRIGRTGRAGQVGEAISLVCREEYSEWRGIERLLRRTVPAFEVEGYVRRPASDTAAEPQRRERPAAERERGGRGARPSRNAPAAAPVAREARTEHPAPKRRRRRRGGRQAS
ncbi:DEAD/DEAH box helicase [Sinimarinibacterium flocculans]|uniref:DEAD-box ATP-dependent RNA helicase RhpA n=1 Tax=Sinimarinibacterium flocculans TaxID=985250 RepID=A0A318EFS7_9GAMM|nr:DEAD/DEAH box helicase [Sinimarinibacterium flocculans]PXV67069.1 ATP-dependent RNA helicase RhlE [Sinimarinibacterium flocculans]